MTRVIAYIDGFNFYQGLKTHRRNHPGTLDHNKVDLTLLVQNHLLQDGESLVAVKWYSAIPPENWRNPEQQSTIQRHKQYRADLEATGVLVRISGFKKRLSKCKHCGRRNREPQEKESDSRCSLEMLEDAFYDRMDRALLITSDSDFVPALYALKRYADIRPVDAIICPPLERQGPAKAVRGACSTLFDTSPRYMHVNGVRHSLFNADNRQ